MKDESVMKQFTNTRDTKGEKIWIYIFRTFGLLMFLAGIWESMVTLFWLNKDVVVMDSFRIYIASIGFVFALAGKNLGIFANKLGEKLLKIV